MRNICLDIGIIQSFLDGELASGEMHRVSAHVAGCEPCALMLAQAEEEAAVVFPVLEREFDTLVPTQRLWGRINESIEIEKQQASIWQKAYAFFSAAFASPSITAVAGLLIVAGVFAVLMIDRSPVQPDIATIAPPPASVKAPLVQTPELTGDDRVTAPIRSESRSTEQAAYRTSARRSKVQTAAFSAGSATAATADYLPGEDSYLKTIASLSKTVDDQKAGGVLRPSQQVAYERDMAVVDDAIAKMRAELKRDPKSESAKKVLYSSYQNKIDLLNSVAQKEELVASLQ